MAVCFCNESAEKILDLIALKRIDQLGRAGEGWLKDCGSGKREVDAALSMLPSMEEPVHLLVSSRKRRITYGNRYTHVWAGGVPEDALIRISPGVFSVSPEFNMLLSMRNSPLVDRALTIMGYCGIFAIDESSEDGFVGRRMLTNIARIRSFAQSVKQNPCSRLLSEAASLALERARSPLEAKLAIALTAPRKIGGFELIRPTLNESIGIGEEGRALIDRDSIVGDMVWKDRRVAIETNGRLRHEGRFGDDLTKASALEMEGYRVRFVTYQQLRSPRQMMLIGRWLMEQLGIEQPLPSMEELRELLAQLISFEYSHISLPPAGSESD